MPFFHLRRSVYFSTKDQKWRTQSGFCVELAVEFIIFVWLLHFLYLLETFWKLSVGNFNSKIILNSINWQGMGQTCMYP